MACPGSILVNFVIVYFLFAGAALTVKALMHGCTVGRAWLATAAAAHSFARQLNSQQQQQPQAATA
jgi:hypothetical protein